MNNNLKPRVAFITGITGQDGSYLAEFLLNKGYHVHGMIRRSSSFNTKRIDHLYQDATLPITERTFFLHYGDLTDSSSVISMIARIKPDEIYNLGAQSHVKVSFDLSEYTGQVDALGTLRLLEAIRACGLQDTVKFYQASSSELFGKVQEVPQTENTPFYPRSPYAVAKLYAYWIVKNFRESYGIFACNGILFNHESPRRGETFVTRKITRSVSEIHFGLREVLELGNLNAERDWGFAGDYVKAMWMMLQLEKPEDFVIATGKKYSVRHFCELAFQHVGISIEWRGEGLQEVGVDGATGRTLVRVKESYFRPAEVDELLGDAAKAQTKLGWKPDLEFHDLVKLMMREDLKWAKHQHMKAKHAESTEST